MMDALEVGRVNVAARGVGIAQRALELAMRYSQERKAFGKPIAEHQAIQFKLADMATKVEAARLLTLRAARMKDAGERSDLEAGMAKLYASEAGRFCVEECFRIHGGYGYSKEYEIERLYRDAPLLLIGEGTSEIQRMVIGKQAAAAPQDLMAALRTHPPNPRHARPVRVPGDRFLMAEDAKSLIERAARRFVEEVPALAPMTLVVERRAAGPRRRPVLPPADARGSGLQGLGHRRAHPPFRCVASSST